MFKILSICKGGHYHYCRTDPPHPKANAKGLYPLHRVKAENAIGRLLAPGEIVHHKDENKQNDDPSNLEVLTNSEHCKQHKLERDPKNVSFTCKCGRTVELKPGMRRLRIKNSQHGLLFCSRSCAGRYTSSLPKLGETNE